MNSFLFALLFGGLYLFFLLEQTLVSGAIMVSLTLLLGLLWFRVFIVLINRFYPNVVLSVLATAAFLCVMTQGMAIPFMGNGGNAITLGITFSLLLGLFAIYLKIQSEKSKALGREEVKKGNLFVAALHHQPLLTHIPPVIKRVIHPLADDEILDVIPSKWNPKMASLGLASPEWDFSLAKNHLKFIESPKTHSSSIKEIEQKENPDKNKPPMLEHSQKVRISPREPEEKANYQSLVIPFKSHSFQCKQTVHIRLEEDFQRGRILRKKGDFLCRSLQGEVPNGEVTEFQISCKSCLNISIRWQG